MGTLGGLATVAKSALLADQTAINVTAQNISNQNTAGYSRRVATWQTNDSVTIGGVEVGTGATLSVAPALDRVLNNVVLGQTAQASGSKTTATALTQLASIFTLGTDGTDRAGISAGLSKLFNAAGALAADGASTSARQDVVDAATDLATAFRNASQQVAAQRTQLDQQASGQVPLLNQLTSQIAVLNGKIASSAGTDPGALVDQREQLLQQLAGVVSFHPVAEDGGQIGLALSSGAMLVDGTYSSALTTSQVNGVTHFLLGAGNDVTSQLQGGSLGGALAARDGQVAGTAALLDQLAGSVAATVNAQNAAGFLPGGGSGGPIFSTVAGQSAAATIAVVAGPADIAAAAAGEGAGGGGNAAQLASLATAVQANGETFSQTFAVALGSLGSAVAVQNSAAAGDQATLSQVQQQQEALSGVSLDSEAANLQQYQRDYEASAKLLTTMDTMFQAALNIGVQQAY